MALVAELLSSCLAYHYAWFIVSDVTCNVTFQFRGYFVLAASGLSTLWT